MPTCRFLYIPGNKGICKGGFHPMGGGLIPGGKGGKPRGSANVPLGCGAG